MIRPQDGGINCAQSDLAVINYFVCSGPLYFAVCADGSATEIARRCIRLAAAPLKIFEGTRARVANWLPIRPVVSPDSNSRLIGLAGGNDDRFFADWLALVNRFRTNADRVATNYNGVGVIDRIAGKPEITRLRDHAAICEAPNEWRVVFRK